MPTSTKAKVILVHKNMVPIYLMSKRVRGYFLTLTMVLITIKDITIVCNHTITYIIYVRAFQGPLYGHRHMIFLIEELGKEITKEYHMVYVMS